jgi:hypothetical protein
MCLRQYKSRCWQVLEALADRVFVDLSPLQKKHYGGWSALDLCHQVTVPWVLKVDKDPVPPSATTMIHWHLVTAIASFIFKVYGSLQVS